ncbi:uncharacterized protein LOC134225178 isoform X2 [Armigeres subalbatus]|uniref:uncharacterized protein LOC134225178 isoform X2 n=1 Tax=Armigeres subalbatus TaxID=124917 RepID=UPI002ED24F42
MTCALRSEILEKVKPRHTSMMDALMRRNSFNISFNKLWHPGTEKTRSKSGSFGSSVAIQKLRESKWFDRGEERIFCAVIEAGFIVELRHPETGESWYGVTAIELKKLAKPTAENIKIYSVKLGDSHKRLKIFNSSLDYLWQQGYQIRINNLCDKTKKAHSEKDIMAQVDKLELGFLTNPICSFHHTDQIRRQNEDGLPQQSALYRILPVR